ncbi:hypothetical protein COCNU_01G013250 [Cocos nucifera]|uniref:Uncharacterized protein n=1 Tax=Cocos nucifera TaxID=13894 RepID=A0A8K0HVI9_COCNU|nr:hypothetical protein COCNU_01G013250 [Cocos nucifera]
MIMRGLVDLPQFFWGPGPARSSFYQHSLNRAREYFLKVKEFRPNKTIQSKRTLAESKSPDRRLAGTKSTDRIDRKHGLEP